MSKTLSNEKSLEIAAKLLDVFQNYANKIHCFFLCYPFYNDFNEYNKEIKTAQKYETFFWNVLEEHFEKRVHSVTNENDMSQHNTFTILDQGVKYEMRIYDSPDSCGFNSILDNYDIETYLLCEISEYDGQQIKFRMHFGFDVLNMTFLELFAIDYINKKNFYRECSNIDEIEKIFFGKKLISDIDDSKITKE